MANVIPWINDDGGVVGWINDSSEVVTWTAGGGGQEATFSQGAAGVLVTVAIAGIAISLSTGAISPNNDGTVPLVGAQIAVQQQTIAPSWAQSIIGSAATSASGTVLVVQIPTQITGQVITASQGTISASGNSVTVNITGEEFSAVTGNLQGGTQAISGSVATCLAGIAAPSLTLAITGIATSCLQGVIAPAQDADDTLITSGLTAPTLTLTVALSGSQTTSATGTLIVTGDAEIPLTGTEITSAAGTIGYGEEFSLVGSSFTAELSSMGVPGGAALTGAEIICTTGNVFTTNDRTFTLSGVSTTVEIETMFASPRVFVTGQELVVSGQEIGPRNVALTGVFFTAETGRLEAPRRDHDAGHAKKRRKHHVEIDGQIFHVESEEEALYFLEKTKEEAQALAQLTLERAQRAQKRPVRKVMQDARKALEIPEIEVSEDLEDPARVILSEIEDLYQDTLRTIEIAALLRKRDEEEEEAILLMLL